MKKYLLVLAMFGFVLYGCDKTPSDVDREDDDTSQTTPPDDDDQNPDNEQPGYETERPQFVITGDDMFTLPAKGGEFEVVLQTNIEYTVAIPEDAESWISVIDTRVLRTEAVVFAVTENDSSESRSTTADFIDDRDNTIASVLIIQNGVNIKNKDTIPNNEIHYTSSDGHIVELGSTYYPYQDGVTFGDGVHLVSHTYENGVGILRFDNPVTQIGSYTFAYCTTLISINIPNSVTEIGKSSFYLSSLTSINIPNSVTKIGDAAFFHCGSLTSITIPESVTEIGIQALCSCDNLSEFRGKFASDDGRCLIVDGVLNSFAPAGLTEYSIPYGVTTIGHSAFDSCRSLKSVTFPYGVTEIGRIAFWGCRSLLNITLNDGLKTIGYQAFYECDDLTNINIPESVTTIGDYAFICCNSLTTSINLPDGLTEIGKAVFSRCKNLPEFRGKFASDDGRCLIVDDVLNSFAPAGLTEYSIPYGVTTIGHSAFDSCGSLKSITIPDGVTAIESDAFWYCSALTSITIPDSVIEIGAWAFCNCTSLESVYCKAITPPTIIYSYYSGFPFNSNAYGRKIYVPYKSLNDYKTAYGWSNYADDIVGYDFENDIIFDIGDIDAEIDGEKVELTAEQLSSPYTADYDGQGLEGLVDGDTSTYWHSVWRDSIPGNETYGYYIDIVLDEPLNHFCFQYCTRATNDNAVPALVTIGGSHDGENWTVLAEDLQCNATGSQQWAVIEAVGSASAEAYEYLRFGVTESAGWSGGNLKGETNNNCVAMSELQLYKLTE